MHPLRDALLAGYYLATLPQRRRAATDRAARCMEPVSVLFYHRVADQHPNGWTMPTAMFARQIRWLKERFDVVDLAEAQLRIASGRNSRPTVAITFDDGYSENIEFAVPLLLTEELPFTYFVSTNHVFGNRPFPHDVDAGRPLEPNSLSQLRELAAAGVEIGAHNRNHVHLGVVSVDVMEAEIVGSKRDLEQALECEVRYFAFPYGQPSDSEHRRISNRLPRRVPGRLFGLRRVQLPGRRSVSPPENSCGLWDGPLEELDDGRSAQASPAAQFPPGRFPPRRGSASSVG